jgi:hypothetical protein
MRSVASPAVSSPPAAPWAGRVLTTIPVLFLRDVRLRSVLR